MLRAAAGARLAWWLAMPGPALAVLPVAFVFGQAAAGGWDAAVAALVRPRVGVLLFNTGRLVLAGTACCLVLGAATAWLVERTDLPLRGALGVLLAVPVAVPAFVRGFGWISVLPGADRLAGALLVVTLTYYPLVYLPVRAALRSADPALEDAARSLGLGPGRTALRVVLPQVRRALIGGGLLVALDLLAEFGAFALLSYPTLTTAIYEQYRVGFDTAAVAPVALLLVALCALVLGGELALRGRRHTRVGAGAPRPPSRHRLGAAAPAALLAVVAVLAAALGEPLAVLGYWLWHGRAGAGEGGFGHAGAGELSAAALNTFALGLAGAAAAMLVALPVALLAARESGPLATVLERLTYLAHVLPGIVVALALVTVSIRLVPGLYQSAPLLVTAYVVLFLPRALVSARSGLERAPPALAESARALGRRPAAVLALVTLPLAAPGLGAGAALVFLSVATELTTTLLLAPIGTDTLATQVWSHSTQLDFAGAAPFAALMVAVSVPATVLLTRQPGGLGREVIA